MKKILVIEDDRAVLKNILDMLQVEGYQVIGAKNGQIGLSLAQEQSFDLIICDIMLPKVDGYEVIRSLHQLPKTQTVPVIFVTAKTERDDMRQGMELGAYDYLTKPFTRDELLGTVQAQLRRQELLTEQYTDQRDRAEKFRRSVEDLQNVNQAREQLLENLISELRQPLSNINMAIRMLAEAPSRAQRDRYLKILQEEFSREISLLNQVSELRQLLTPENINLLTQFKLLQNLPNSKRPLNDSQN